jgi:hypothetical protein
MQGMKSWRPKRVKEASVVSSPLSFVCDYAHDLLKIELTNWQWTYENWILTMGTQTWTNKEQASNPQTLLLSNAYVLLARSFGGAHLPVGKNAGR